VLLLKDPWTIENDSLTPTLKLKRRVILAKHGNEIEKLYEDFGK
jgi:long-chain acyl-CoA synthetase